MRPPHFGGPLNLQWIYRNRQFRMNYELHEQCD